MVRRQSNKYAADYLADGSLQVNVNFSSVCKLCRSINQSISTNHLHKNDQWLTNKVKNNKTKIKPNE